MSVVCMHAYISSMLIYDLVCVNYVSCMAKQIKVGRTPSDEDRRNAEAFVFFFFFFNVC